jgi:hypothetical protein
MLQSGTGRPAQAASPSATNNTAALAARGLKASPITVNLTAHAARTSIERTAH